MVIGWAGTYWVSSGAFNHAAQASFVDLPCFPMLTLIELPLSSLSLCAIDRYWPGAFLAGWGLQHTVPFLSSGPEGRMSLPLLGYRPRLLWLVPKLEEAGVGQNRARCDDGLPVSHWLDVDVKAGASAATVET